MLYSIALRKELITKCQVSSCFFFLISYMQPHKYQLSSSQVSDISKSVVKDKKLIVHNSYQGAI